MRMDLTVVFHRVPEGYIAWVEEIPGTNTQGDTLEEARANLEEAVQLVIETNRMLARAGVPGKPLLRERVSFEVREAA
jgi:predicted RNase H-like HicB family nuclease